jgi:hypothetical protein
MDGSAPPARQQKIRQHGASRHALLLNQTLRQFVTLPNGRLPTVMVNDPMNQTQMAPVQPSRETGCGYSAATPSRGFASPSCWYQIVPLADGRSYPRATLLDGFGAFVHVIDFDQMREHCKGGRASSSPRARVSRVTIAFRRGRLYVESCSALRWSSLPWLE